MKKPILLSLILLFTGLTACNQKNTEETHAEKAVEEVINQKKPSAPISLVIHGGAGNISRESLSAEQDSLYRVKLREALEAGYQVLSEGKPAMDAVIAAIQIMEASPLFNAGKGAVFTAEGKNELDASVMDGKDRNAGAVAGVTTIKSPIAAAREVMNNSPHVMMSGPGAELFAQEQGLDIVDPAYFFVQRRYDALQRIKASEAKDETAYMQEYPDYKFGTVGCVALDKDGNIAAGTSTGGMTNKKYGRIGDAPIIAAGTYADNNSCGVSATGHGEYFIRSVVAYDIAAKMKYLGLSLADAASQVVDKELVSFGGEGGIIALDKAGNITMPFNTSGMFRGFKNRPDQANVYIYEDEK